MLPAQTGKYVVHAKDLPCANKLPWVQQPIKQAEFEKHAWKILINWLIKLIDNQVAVLLADLQNYGI